ncbi:FAD-dependent oxidoreductase, partial [Aromatoleum toluclasticum]|uniref:FAD-dependent oxidoreductase n=1 Tax=Aromatoleum toluclasticum TaxID=92003 RepID=UPI001D18A161
NIGSAPRMGDVAAADAPVVPVKPIRNFRRRWLDLLQRVCTHREPTTTIAVVGAGAGGVELLLAMQHRLRAEIRANGRQPDQLRFHLFTSSAQILPTHSARVRERFLRELAARGVLLHVGAEVGRVSGGHIETCNGVSVDADEIVWVTHAGGGRWLRDTGLALDSDGFVQVEDSLCTVSDERIFAAGDVASLVSGPLAKAGVFAVRQGPILAENLRRAALGRPLLRYRPQRRWLALITTGDRYAVASWGPIGLAGRWVWRWKDAIDRRFMARYRDLPAR